MEANRQLSELVSGVLEENELLRADLEKTRADLAVLQRMLFGRKSEKDRPGPPGGGAVMIPLVMGSCPGTGRLNIVPLNLEGELVESW